jgi:hypothetical protein
MAEQFKDPRYEDSDQWEGFDSLTKSERFIVKWQYGILGDFHAALIEAIKRADTDNLEKLRQGFPEEVGGYINYTQISGWWQKVQKKAGIKNDLNSD